MTEPCLPYMVAPVATARRFHLLRHQDVTGVSGTGVVAQGVQFYDGTCVLYWVGAAPSVVVHRNLDNVIAVHCHGGLTSVVFEDIG